MSLYLPAHSNEFHDAKGHLWYPKSDPFSGTVCWAATGVMLLDAGSRGALTATVPAFRLASGNKRRRGNIEDIANGLTALGLTPPMLRFYGLPRAQARDLLLAPSRRFAALEVDNELVPKTCSPSFDGDHLVLVLPRTSVMTALVNVGDPTCDAAHLVDLDKLLDAACQYARQQGEPRNSVNMGYIRQPREPKPDPVDPRDSRIDELEAQVDALLADMAVSDAAVHPHVVTA